MTTPDAGRRTPDAGRRTPDAEENQLFETLDAAAFRHPDHRFE